MGQRKKREPTLGERFNAGVEVLRGSEERRQRRMKEVGPDITRSVGDRSSVNNADDMLLRAREDLQRNQVQSRRSRPLFETEKRSQGRKRRR